MRWIRKGDEPRRPRFGRTGGWMLAVVLVAAISMSGCWGGQSGPARYQVSGKVTYAGQPVPGGMIYFDPDTAKGNHGPQGSGRIEDGKYQTSPGHGAVGGPHVVRITGYEAAELEPAELFPTYTTEVDLPKESASLDFDVPATHRFKTAPRR